MCTAATYRTRDHYFGRTLDYEFSYAEEVTITPVIFPSVSAMSGRWIITTPSSAWQLWRRITRSTTKPPMKKD